MNWNYIFETIKYILENLCFIVALVSSLIFHHITDEKREDYIEYTSVSKPISINGIYGNYKKNKKKNFKTY